MYRIAELRIQKGLSQKEFGKQIGAAQNTVSNWEKGNRVPDAPTLNKIANFFGVSVDYLLGNDNSTGTNISVVDENKNPIVLDDEALELIDSLRSNPEMKMLFSVSKNATKEDIIKAVKIIEAIKDNK